MGAISGSLVKDLGDGYRPKCRFAFCDTQWRSSLAQQSNASSPGQSMDGLGLPPMTSNLRRDLLYTIMLSVRMLPPD